MSKLRGRRGAKVIDMYFRNNLINIRTDIDDCFVIVCSFVRPKDLFVAGAQQGKEQTNQKSCSYDQVITIAAPPLMLPRLRRSNPPAASASPNCKGNGFSI